MGRLVYVVEIVVDGFRADLASNENSIPGLLGWLVAVFEGQQQLVLWMEFTLGRHEPATWPGQRPGLIA